MESKIISDSDGGAAGRKLIIGPLMGVLVPGIYEFQRSG
jgi:hypothetical protein